MIQYIVCTDDKNMKISTINLVNGAGKKMIEKKIGKKRKIFIYNLLVV